MEAPAEAKASSHPDRALSASVEQSSEALSGGFRFSVVSCRQINSEN
jgi:hypothetical protein